ncbi:transmembrane 4 L6 family member 1-like [Hyaena hyaena]|uniref:transmembrane 4 L6 family member 1-like n=1 Tax=Hyaena hyaena TaxID=95912 RepID=UPI00192237A5|nr:transmembrane 4 L6 family member 1-like [Hyaena hyaena]
MCSETGSRCSGMLLLALAIMAIIANLLLYFPNGQVLELAKITDLVWFFHGFFGAGLLVMVPALMLLRGGGGVCCARRCGMLFPVLLAIQGTMGAMYCVVISSLGLLSGPFCDTGSGNYTYPFRNNTLEDNYLFNQPTWAICREPEHIVLWNVVLLSILLGIGVVEAVLCLSQAASGLGNIFCGTCVRKGQPSSSTPYWCYSSQLAEEKGFAEPPPQSQEHIARMPNPGDSRKLFKERARECWQRDGEEKCFSQR